MSEPFPDFSDSPCFLTLTISQAQSVKSLLQHACSVLFAHLHMSQISFQNSPTMISYVREYLLCQRRSDALLDVATSRNYLVSKT